ncbi:MAG: primosomal protein N' [Rhodoferax sp.]|nr:primosomal protein N' [Rhodoferax sp.]
MTHCLPVLVQTPAYSALAGPLRYHSAQPLPPGTLVRVPLGRRELLGVVWDRLDEAAEVDPEHIRPLAGVLEGLAPLPASWRQLVRFCADYYQRSPGEVALAALPPSLRSLTPVQIARRLRRQGAPAAAPPPAEPASPPLEPTSDQRQVMAQLAEGDGPFLLFGATGSGKTEVYLRCVERLLARDPQAQALVMVPEINLTPQLQARFVARFGASIVVTLHSGMTPAQRLTSWLAAHQGSARILLGTRMAVLAPLARLRLIVVDEEHDPSYKSQEGARYSARDLAVYRGRLEGAQVLLGSATPSLESWHHSRPAAEGGRYLRLDMPSRIGAAAALPGVRRIDMNHQPRHCLIAPPLLQAIAERVARGEQSMLLLNRRGYAPVLHCGDCGWKSDCPHCSAYRVFHKVDRSLRCHHCGLASAVPRSCPSCGNADIAPVGRGTERLEEHLGEQLANLRRPEGGAVRMARIDADSTRARGALEQQLAQVHAGEVDVLVGTQMVAKGHDFRRITLVAAINPDGALFSSDFRAPERLFALLMQAAGRAGRDAALSRQAEMWVQTFHPQHPLFEALRRYDYPGFAARQLQERAQAGMPPFAFQALLRAEAGTQESAQGFLEAARAVADTGLPHGQQAGITLYPAVPMTLQRIANVERAQILIESASRMALQRFLAAWQPLLHGLHDRPGQRGVRRWVIDVDPLLI